jgi:hypothetical protein
MDRGREVRLSFTGDIFYLGTCVLRSEDVSIAGPEGILAFPAHLLHDFCMATTLTLRLLVSWYKSAPHMH